MDKLVRREERLDLWRKSKIIALVLDSPVRLMSRLSSSSRSSMLSLSLSNEGTAIFVLNCLAMLSVAIAGGRESFVAPGVVCVWVMCCSVDICGL